MKKRNETIRMLVLSAMFAALCCVTTMLVQFPTVAGYTNIGEGMCLLAGLVLGPWYGASLPQASAAVLPICWQATRIMFPARLSSKGLVALVAALLLRPMLKKGEKIPFWRLALIELPSEVIMVAGYFGYKALILGKGPCRRRVDPEQSGAGRRRHRFVRRALHRAGQGSRNS